MSSRVGPVRGILLVAIFCVSLAAFDRLLAAAIEHATFSSDLRAELGRKLIEARGQGPYDVLVLGTSRAYEAIHPLDILEQTGARAYKEAFQGRGPRYFLGFYRQYRRIVGKPRVVVYGVDYFFYGIRSTEVRLAALDAPKDESPRSRWRWPLRLVENKKMNDQALVKALQLLQAGAESPHATPDPERYAGDMAAYRGSKTPRKGDPAEPEPSQYPKSSFQRFPGEEGGYMLKLFDALEADGVKVVLVGIPDFIATYRTNNEQQLFTDSFTRLAASRRDCVFLNYNTPERFPLSEPSYFLDGRYGNPNSHLSRAGVTRFVRAFMPDLKVALGQAASASRSDAR